MTMQATPGPWKNDGRATVWADDMLIADCGKETSSVAQANANLIAAAPDLLEACKDALGKCSCTIKERLSGHKVDCFASVVEAAIAKAEGIAQ